MRVGKGESSLSEYYKCKGPEAACLVGSGCGVAGIEVVRIE